MPPFCFPYLENNTTSANYGCQYSLMCIGDWIIWNKLNEWKHRFTLFLLRLPWTVNNDFRTHVVNRRMTQGSKNPPGCDVNLYQKNITLTRAFEKAERHSIFWLEGVQAQLEVTQTTVWFGLRSTLAARSTAVTTANHLTDFKEYKCYGADFSFALLLGTRLQRYSWTQDRGSQL